MRNNDFFAKVVKTVSEETETAEESILSKERTSDTVDARMMVTEILTSAGYSTKRAAKWLGCTEANIRRLRSIVSVRARTCKQFASKLELLRKLLL